MLVQIFGSVTKDSRCWWPRHSKLFERELAFKLTLKTVIALISKSCHCKNNNAKKGHGKKTNDSALWFLRGHKHPSWWEGQKTSSRRSKKKIRMIFSLSIYLQKWSWSNGYILEPLIQIPEKSDDGEIWYILSSYVHNVPQHPILVWNQNLPWYRQNGCHAIHANMVCLALKQCKYVFLCKVLWLQALNMRTYDASDKPLIIDYSCLARPW